MYVIEAWANGDTLNGHSPSRAVNEIFATIKQEGGVKGLDGNPWDDRVLEHAIRIEIYDQLAKRNPHLGSLGNIASQINETIAALDDISQNYVTKHSGVNAGTIKEQLKSVHDDMAARILFSSEDPNNVVEDLSVLDANTMRNALDIFDINRQKELTLTKNDTVKTLKKNDVAQALGIGKTNMDVYRENSATNDYWDAVEKSLFNHIKESKNKNIRSIVDGMGDLTLKNINGEFYLYPKSGKDDKDDSRIWVDTTGGAIHLQKIAPNKEKRLDSVTGKSYAVITGERAASLRYKL
jgi:hypothetical protein